VSAWSSVQRAPRRRFDPPGGAAATPGRTGSPCATIAGVPVNEEGPGIGVWLSLGLGVLAGVFLGWPLAGFAGAVAAFLVVAVVGALLLS
jgi:hypothetical protein